MRLAIALLLISLFIGLACDNGRPDMSKSDIREFPFRYTSRDYRVESEEGLEFQIYYKHDGTWNTKVIPRHRLLVGVRDDGLDITTLRAEAAGIFYNGYPEYVSRMKVIILAPNEEDKKKWEKHLESVSSPVRVLPP